MRDSLLFEDKNKIILLGGIPEEWFKNPSGIKLKNMWTHFGTLSLDYRVNENLNSAVLEIFVKFQVTAEICLRWPSNISAKFEDFETKQELNLKSNDIQLGNVKKILITFK
jgi:hypothetical protein